MRLAYIVSAYKYPDQVVRLVNRLDAGDTSFFVHVDRNADERVFRAIELGLADDPFAQDVDILVAVALRRVSSSAILSSAIAASLRVVGS